MTYLVGNNIFLLFVLLKKKNMIKMTSADVTVEFTEKKAK